AQPDCGTDAHRFTVSQLAATRSADIRHLSRFGIPHREIAARVSPSGWTQERLYEIFDERYTNQRPVLITCDVLPNKLADV
ncbi:hypothetical protein KBZ21_41935, partial [Streptomyces sp. A73]|nr:hypothetical protein [Streptomyces sp. A73]